MLKLQPPKTAPVEYHRLLPSLGLIPQKKAVVPVSHTSSIFNAYISLVQRLLY